MRSLWTNWVQAVHTSVEKLVGYAPVLGVINSNQQSPVGESTVYARFVQVLYPAYSTAVLDISNLLVSTLSPLSTPPITTTTKYLN